MKLLPYDQPHFLMPAHDHDPVDVSNLTNVPLSVFGYLPDEVRELLCAVQEATSIIFASFNRLGDLLSQRLDRLSIVRDENRTGGAADVQYSEPAFSWYQHQVMTEARYLVTEAYPDWKHKAMKVEHACRRQGIMLDPDMLQSVAQGAFAKWFSTLKYEVQEWKRISDAVEVPDFDYAVADLKALQVGRKSSNHNQHSPGTELNGGMMPKIEKVDSGIDF